MAQKELLYILKIMSRNYNIIIRYTTSVSISNLFWITTKQKNKINLVQNWFYINHFSWYYFEKNVCILPAQFQIKSIYLPSKMKFEVFSLILKTLPDNKDTHTSSYC